MKITWVGHSCFKIEEEGFVIIVDPYADGSVPGYKNVREKANLVLCSHLHGDHHGTECVEIISGKDNLFTVETIEIYHDEVLGSKRGNNTIHIIGNGEIKIAHLGDLGCELSENQKAALKDTDVLLIPVGGFYTIGAEQAASLVHDITPKHVIPMHYRGKKSGYNVLGTVESFAERMDSMIELAESIYDTDSEIAAQMLILKAQNED